MGGEKGNGPSWTRCAGCGSVIESDGAYCIEGRHMFVSLRGQQPHYTSATERDAAMKALRKGGMESISEFGMDEMSPVTPYYFTIPEVQELLCIKVQANIVPGIIWHNLELFSDGAWCYCKICAESQENRCSTCSTQLHPLP